MSKGNNNKCTRNDFKLNFKTARLTGPGKVSLTASNIIKDFYIRNKPKEG